MYCNLRDPKNAEENLQRSAAVVPNIRMHLAYDMIFIFRNVITKSKENA
jgi:hypothetical protein